MESKNSILAKGLKTIKVTNIILIIYVIVMIMAMVAIIGGMSVAIAGMMFGGTGAEFLLESPVVEGWNFPPIDPEIASVIDGTAMVEIGFLVAGIGIIAVIIDLVLAICITITQIVGLFPNRKIHTGYKNAMIVVIVNFVISFLSLVIGIFAFMEMLVSVMVIKGLIMNCILCYFIINSTTTLLRENGEEMITAKGPGILRLNFIFCGISVIGNLMALFESTFNLSIIVTFVGGIGLLVVTIKYISFLGKSSKFFSSARLM